MIKECEVYSYGILNRFRENNFNHNKPDDKEVFYCRQFIKQFLKPCKRGHSSYHFKHSVESYYNNYISNGAFIKAAMLEGCKIELFNLSSPNVRILMDYKKEYIRGNE